MIKKLLFTLLFAATSLGQQAGIWIPEFPSDPVNGVDWANTAVSGASDKYANCMQAPKTGSIRQIGMRFGTTTTGDTLDVRVETIAANGFPSGTLWAANTNVSLVLDAADDNVWKETGNLTADASVTKGDFFCVVVVNGSVPGVYNHSSITDHQNTFPYVAREVSSSWSFRFAYSPSMGIEYSDGSYAYIPHTYPFIQAQEYFFNNSDTPDERALYFQLPYSVVVTGFWAFMASNTGGDFDIVLYDSDGTTALLTESFDGDHSPNLGNAYLISGLFNSTTTLSASTNYRLTVKPTTATDVELAYIEVPDAAKFDQMGGGQNFHLSTRTDAGGWTETTTERPFVGLIIEDFSGGGSGGSSYISPGGNVTR